MVSLLEEIFSGLTPGNYQVTSPPDRDYNCIAWAAGDNRNWWWPGPDPEMEYWPPTVPRERTRAAFVAAFATLGYALCENEDPEAGYQKIALFADDDGKPTHAARQLPNGRWSSKIGKADDIEHRLRDLEGTLYGAVVLIMKRVEPK
jgi:hypothetical protein